MGNDKQHALLSASASHRWLHCTPSVRLEEQFEDRGSDYAKEGTLAHDICELKLKKKFTPMSSRSFTTAMNKLKKHELYQEEMQGYTDIYVDYITEIIYGLPTKPYTAFEKKLNYSTYAKDGFGTADCLIIHGDTLRVIDFKYGKGVPVSAEDNPQMKLYALGAISEFGFIYPIQKVIVSIVQPRLDSISEWETSFDDLIAFGNNVVKPAAEKAHMGVGDFIAGEHCKFCRAKAKCRVRAEENMKLTQFEFKKPPLLTNEEVGTALSMALDLKKWASDLEEFALDELLKGNDVQGWKVVEGRSNRAFVNVEEAFTRLTNSGVESALLYERKPISLTAVEKLIGKKQFDEILVNDICKPQGKPALVPESDKREPYQLSSAKNDFQ